MKKIGGVLPGLHLLEIEITGKCNKNCKICYNEGRRGDEDMMLEDIIRLIELANDNNVGKVVLSGGEASLHGKIFEIAEYLLSGELKTKIAIQTNGNLSTKSKDMIKAFDIIHLSFEIDGEGSVRDTSVDETLKKAKFFQKQGVYTYLFATVHPGNVDKIDWMVEIANKNKIDIGFNLCLLVKDCQEMILSDEQKVMAVRKLHQYFLEGKILRFTSPITAVLKEQKTADYVGVKGGCVAGVAACIILSNGDVCPCPFLRVKSGNIYEKSFEDVWLNSKEFGVLRDRGSFQGNCAGCDYLSHCGGCRARAYKDDGLLNGRDNGCLKEKLEIVQ